MVSPPPDTLDALPTRHNDAEASAPPAAAIPTDPDTLLRRRPLSDALTAAGFPVANATLATLAVRGGGPPFQRWGRIPLYTWGTSLHWARAWIAKPLGWPANCGGMTWSSSWAMRSSV